MASVKVESASITSTMAQTSSAQRQSVMPTTANSARSANNTTTTLSTIAVRAEPHSTIVVAIVKSVGFVELRIDEMQPGLLQIGANPSENSELLQVHEDLYTRLLGKQEQVEELLGRAEKLVTEQTEPDDILIYEAMADGLATAWKSLSRQLSLRGYVLADTQQLYEIALKHEELAKLTNSRLNNSEAVNEKRHELQRIIDELAELTREGLEIGSAVISQIRILGALADNDERPREALNSCLAIEKIMLRIAQSWEIIENSWRMHRDDHGEQQQKRHGTETAEVPLMNNDNIIISEQQQPKQPQQHGQMTDKSANNEKKPSSSTETTNLSAAEQWLLTAAQRFDHVHNSNDEDELLKLAMLITEIKANYASLKAISEHIDPVLCATSATRCDQLLEHYNRLLKEVQLRSDLLERTHAMLQKTDMLLVQLDKMRDDLRHASAAMAGELGPLAQQKGIALIEDGVQLSAQWEREPAGGQRWGPAVDTRVERLKEAVIDVVRMARDRIASSKADKLREMLASLENWLHSVAEQAMSQPIKIANAADTVQFLNELRLFSNDLTYKEQQLRSLVASQQKAQPFVPSEEQRLDKVHAGISRVRQMVETRMQIGQTMEQLYKLSRELDTALHFLGTLLTKDSANYDQNGAVLLQSDELYQKQMEQMRNLLQQANEHIYRERHQSEKLVSLANSMNGTDPALIINPALEWSRSSLNRHGKELKRLTMLSKQWEIEQQKRRQTMKMPPFVAKAPLITVPLPFVHQALYGTRVELSAKFEASPEPRAWWSKDGEQIDEQLGHRRLDLLPNGMATLTIEELWDTDVGEYALLLQNEHGQAESRCQVNVEKQQQPRAPAAKCSNNEQIIGEVIKQLNNEQQPTLVCTTTTVTQFESAEDVPSGTQHGHHVQAVHAPAAVEQQQQPPCKPHFVRQLVNVSGREGCPFMLDCVVVGVPEPKIIWYREEQTVRESDRFRLAFRGDHCTLTCTEARPEDAGLYKVLAVNVHGETMQFCRVCIVPPSPKRGISGTTPPPTAPKPSTTTPIFFMARRVESDELMPEIVTIKNDVQPLSDDSNVVPPVIEPQLCSQVVREGQTVNFQVHITGIPMPEVRWFYNGTPIHIDSRQDLVISTGPEWNSHLLNIPKVVLGHSGQYCVEARNSVGQTRSSATLNVLLGLDGETTSKTVATTTPTSGYVSPQWFLQQQQQQHSTTAFPNHLGKDVINNNNSQQHMQFDQRSWSCQSIGSSTTSPRAGAGIVYALSSSKVSSSDRAESRRSSNFDNDDPGLGYSSLANAPEFIRAFQSDVTINEGERAEVDCLMVGNPRPKIHWFFNDRPVKSSPGFFEFSNVGDTYTIRFTPGARLDCAGYYRLCAENSRGRVESQTLIHIRPKSMIPKPLRQRRSLGDARAVGSMPEALLRMQHEQQQWVKTAASLHQLMDAQQIRHRTPPQPRGSAPHFVQTLVSVVAPEGQNAKFEAIVTGVPTPRIEWSKDGEPLVESDNVYFWTDNGRDYLVIEHTGPNDMGKYSCTAENSFGMASSSAQLLLRSKTIAPDFVQRLVSEEVEEGMPLKWQVQIIGDPVPSVKWLLDGQQIQAGHDGVQFVQQDSLVHALLIDAVQLQNAGQYTCVVENSAGEARSTADLVARRMGTAPGKYVHVTKVTQERHQRGEEMAKHETVSVDEIDEQEQQQNGINNEKQKLIE